MKAAFAAAMIVALAGAALAACSREERDSTPLPTRQTTIDRVHKGLDSADQEAQKRREAMDAAANK